MIPSRKDRLFASILFFLAVSRIAFPQTAQHGIKVVSISTDSSAAKMGFAPGDILLSWNQGTRSGVFFWPSDLPPVYRELSPRGPWTILGLRHGETISWKIAPSFLLGSDEPKGLVSEPAAPSVAAVLQQIRTLADAGQWREARQFCLTHCSSSGNADGARSYLFFQAGLLMADAQQMTEAGVFYQKAIDAAPSRLPYLMSEIYGNWGDQFYRLNQWASAADRYQKALHRADTLDARSLNSAYYLDALSKTQGYASRLLEAIGFCKRALGIRETLPDNMDTSVTVMRLGVLYSQWGDLHSAERLLLRSLSLANKLHFQNVSNLYLNLGSVARTRGDLAAAEQYFLKCLELKTKLHAPDKEFLDVWGSLGGVAVDRGNFLRANYYYTRAVESQEKLKTRNEQVFAHALTDLGLTKHLLGEDSGALVLERRALAIDEELSPNGGDMAGTLSAYGASLKATGDWENAEAAFLRALAIESAINPRSTDTAAAEADLADFYLDKHDNGKALTHYSAACETYRVLAPTSPHYAYSLAQRASIEEQLNQKQQALRDYARAIDLLDQQGALLERSDGIRFSNVHIDHYNRYAALLLDQHQTAKAFEIADHARARTLVRTLSRSSVNLRNAVPAALLEKDQTLERQLAQLGDERLRILTAHREQSVAEVERKIKSSEFEHDLVEEQMRKANASYASLTAPKAAGITQIQALLDADTVLLEYALGETGSSLFAVDSRNVKTFGLPAKAQIDALARATYEEWSKRATHAYPGDSALKLSDTILAPAAALLSGKRRVFVVADGALQYVPFGALPVSGSLAEPMVSRFEIVNLPSAGLLAALRQHPSHRGRGQNTITVIADPVFAMSDPRVTPRNKTTLQFTSIVRGASEADDFADEAALNSAEASERGLAFHRLIHSREEAEAIASVSRNEQFKVALDFEANRDTALNAQVAASQVIHFSTHGIFDSKNPAMSGLVLSLVDKNGNPQNGFLGLDDIYRSHISADLVVLSACETALGEEVNGEGLVGLTWGFIYAGAKSVVASLWPVNDASTAELMRTFYAGMYRQGLTPAAALRQAQFALSQRPEWSSPYYWAGFIIEGDGGRR